MKERIISRGDLFYYDFGDRVGSVQSGERPVLVVQADDYNKNAPTVIVAAVTSVIKKRYLPSHIILGDKFGLKKPSMVLLEQVQTVNKDELSDYIGTIEDEHLLRQINATLKKTFGLWVYNPENEKNIRCLCQKCLKNYIHNPDYIVRRLDPFAKEKDRCDKCNQSGWDYVVTKRNYKK
ncbi:type II toxin-antitoxin system PemK/MazF family toxin [Clostridium perfringens]|uniref:type II toxin-antitoxin system PemK/MazF family toxin n=1 Tax=Clostridium perfringens TaxID=1502 RepID=UPI0022471D30|nr:type II toxin-antitoxin system PemK/MazF family toxin [Clostridium perfringens]MCX0366245.1 type II toxin-antitoxin system PemK/MazF family toxin [Clostridium perfringens]